MEWLARTYVHAMNCIHYLDDNTRTNSRDGAARATILRTMAFGIAGLSGRRRQPRGDQVLEDLGGGDRPAS